MSFLTQATVDGLIASYGYAAIFGIILLESAGIPLPGEIILIGAAIYAGLHDTLDIRLIIGTAAAAAIVGDNIGYWFGRKVGRIVLLRRGHLIGLDQQKLDLGEYLFLRHGGKIVFLGRFVAVLRVFAAVLAGVNRFPPMRFLLFNALGGITWAIAVGTGGFVLGQSFHRLAGPFRLSTVVAAAIGLFLIWRYYKHHEEQLFRDAERELGGKKDGVPMAAQAFRGNSDMVGTGPNRRS
ncbi:DedA family protein [Bradyrhizobium cenepequi]|uniref:DedA family protein n=1 Tax=Bradyrhizobium cenepequi TaxID=2821403 RepID=UPI001CE2B7CE|nr:DedA family protein [Bradyrhizobium cenepequi]MCA6109305.1 DedA family protein [Bradyrhizobium cenepequi]